MIRRDYILRQLEQFAAMLARITGLARNEQWHEASALAGGELQKLTGVEPTALLQLSEAALLARLIENESYVTVESKYWRRNLPALICWSSAGCFTSGWRG